jgi:hypothetical protein
VYDKALRLCVWNIDDHREDTASHHEDEELEKINGLPGSKKTMGHECHSGQSKAGFSTDLGTITNLMSEDAYNVMSFFWIGHYIWAIPLKVLYCIRKMNASPSFTLLLQCHHKVTQLNYHPLSSHATVFIIFLLAIILVCFVLISMSHVSLTYFCVLV